MKNIKLIILTLTLITALVGCSTGAGGDSEEQPQNNRVDTVGKLLNREQIFNYVIKYEGETGISKAIERIDKKIEEGHEDYIADKGSFSSSDIEMEHEYKKNSEGQYYIDVNVKYIATFTSRRFTGITYVTTYRDVEFDIGNVKIMLDVDYTEDGYILKGRKIK